MHNDDKTLNLEPVALKFESMDTDNVFLMDAGFKLFLWYGKKARNTIKSKSRLMAEKINKNERKNKAEIIMEVQNNESIEFLRLLGIKNISEKPQLKTIPDEWNIKVPILYIVQLGLGFLEIPQVSVPQHKLVHTLLNSKNVYLLDCHTDVFVWFGKKSTRLVRCAAIKLSLELFSMICRPNFSMITRVQEGTENQCFKSKFSGWDEVIAVCKHISKFKLKFFIFVFRRLTLQGLPKALHVLVPICHNGPKSKKLKLILQLSLCLDNQQ